MSQIPNFWEKSENSSPKISDFLTEYFGQILNFKANPKNLVESANFAQIRNFRPPDKKELRFLLSLHKVFNLYILLVS